MVLSLRQRVAVGIAVAASPLAFIAPADAGGSACRLSLLDGGAGGLHVAPGDEQRLYARIRAFGRPRRPTDSIPGQWLWAVPEGDPGASRLLRPAKRPYGAIYAIPLQSGGVTGVCLLVTQSIPVRGCGAPGTAESYALMGRLGGCSGTLFQIIGIVPDGVARVGIFIDHRLARTGVDHNVFTLTRVVAARTQTLNAVVLRYRDGRVVLSQFGIWKPSRAAIEKT